MTTNAPRKIPEWLKNSPKVPLPPPHPPKKQKVEIVVKIVK